MIYAEYTMHENSQVKVENICIKPIYTFERLGLGIYGPYIYIYSDLGACT